MKKLMGTTAMACLFVFVLVFSFTLNLLAGDHYLSEGDCCEQADPPLLGVWNGPDHPGGWCDCAGLYIGGGQYSNPNNCPLWCPSGS